MEYAFSFEAGSGGMAAGSGLPVRRRRPRTATRRSIGICFRLTAAEHQVLAAAAGRLRMAAGAFAAESAMAAARRLQPGGRPAVARPRDRDKRAVLGELLAIGAGLSGVSADLHQAVRALAATGTAPSEPADPAQLPALAGYAARCDRLIGALEELIDQYRGRLGPAARHPAGAGDR